jgi:magnesium-transporting ATPase (P-type)
MHRRPFRPERAIVHGSDAFRLSAEGGLMAAASLGALSFGAARHGSESAEARTMGFVSLVASQLLHALSARSPQPGPADRPLRPNPALTGLLLASAGLQAIGLFVPSLRAALGVARLGLVDLAVTAAAGVLPYAANEAIKHVRPGAAVQELSS